MFQPLRPEKGPTRPRPAGGGVTVDLQAVDTLDQEPDTKAEAQDDLNPAVVGGHPAAQPRQQPSRGARDHRREHERHPGHHEGDQQDDQRGQGLLAQEKPAPGNQGQRRGVEGKVVRLEAMPPAPARKDRPMLGGFGSVVGAFGLGGRTSARSPTAISRTPKARLIQALRVSLVESPCRQSGRRWC